MRNQKCRKSKHHAHRRNQCRTKKRETPKHHRQWHQRKNTEVNQKREYRQGMEMKQNNRQHKEFRRERRRNDITHAYGKKRERRHQKNPQCCRERELETDIVSEKKWVYEKHTCRRAKNAIDRMSHPTHSRRKERYRHHKRRSHRRCRSTNKHRKEEDSEQRAPQRFLPIQSTENKYIHAKDSNNRNIISRNRDDMRKTRFGKTILYLFRQSAIPANDQSQHQSRLRFRYDTFNRSFRRNSHRPHQRCEQSATLTLFPPILRKSTHKTDTVFRKHLWIIKVIRKSLRLLQCTRKSQDVSVGNIGKSRETSKNKSRRTGRCSTSNRLQCRLFGIFFLLDKPYDQSSFQASRCWRKRFPPQHSFRRSKPCPAENRPANN